MGGDLEKIKITGQYMVEVRFRSSCASCPRPALGFAVRAQVWKALGMDMQKVEFLSCSDQINMRSNEYWALVMDISRTFTLKRIVR